MDLNGGKMVQRRLKEDLPQFVERSHAVCAQGLKTPSCRCDLDIVSHFTVIELDRCDLLAAPSIQLVVQT
jgi:hypothetical protein